eukprot:gene10085-8935_t
MCPASQDPSHLSRPPTRPLSSNAADGRDFGNLNLSPF